MQNPRQGRRTGPAWAVVIVVVLVCLAAGAGGTWFLLRDKGTEQDTAASAGPAKASEDDDGATGGTESGSASASTAPSSGSAPTTSAPPGPRAMTEGQALAELEALRAASLPRLVLDGRWVAQVASKSVGITDPLQTAANGTHTFYAVDILAESLAVTSKVAASSVLVLHSDDFGKRSFAADGRPYWVTVVDVGFPSDDDVTAWCAGTYPTLTPEQLANACAPRTLVPPHD